MKSNNSTAKALFKIAPRNNNINKSSTYAPDSFQITNNSSGNNKIDKVLIDISSSIFPDLVFDPFGKAGDKVSKKFTVDKHGNTGITNHKFLKAHDGGFDALEITFKNFTPGKTFTFSLDNDPTSTRGLPPPGPNHAASVSGLELTGSMIQIDFSNGSKLSNQTYRIPKSVVGSQAVVKANLLPAPKVDILGLNSNKAVVSNAQQTVRISGKPGSSVALLHVEGALFTKNGKVFDRDPFEANTALSVKEKFVKVGGKGFVDVPLTLTKSNQEGGLNHIVAAFKDSQGNTGKISKIHILELDPNSKSQPKPPKSQPNPKPIIDPGSDITDGLTLNSGGKNYTDKSGDLWLSDRDFSKGRTYAKKVAIAGTKDDVLYQTERSGKKFSYGFDVDKGKYDVTLNFAEIFWGKAGKRVFDVKAEGKLVINDLDIYAEAGGKNKALTKTFTVGVTDGELNLDFIASVNNAKVSAIEIEPIGDI